MSTNLNCYLKIILSIITFLHLTFHASAQHHSKIETTIASTVATIVGNEAEQCTAADCNERGTCLGSKMMPICVCQLGFAGPTCKEMYCDPAQNCSGHGWCFGTTSQFACFCNIGFTGKYCETEMMTQLSFKPKKEDEETKIPHHKLQSLEEMRDDDDESQERKLKHNVHHIEINDNEEQGDSETNHLHHHPHNIHGHH